jgi:1-acyl-sn-glycerol-3-phosphate acyltransferase
MRKLIAYPLTILFFIAFALSLVVFHPIQWICYNVFGYEAHKRSVAILNWFLLRSTNFLGTRYRFTGLEKIPTGRPLIVVTNHQSMYDIPPIIWYMRRFHPKFVSKKELGKGIPSVSFNLRYGGSVLIDRKDSKQALGAIAELGAYIEKHKRAAVIFPEGTRSRDGKPKKFHSSGLRVLIENAPNALIVPISINNSWKMVRYGKFPLGIGNYIQHTVHSPLEINKEAEELIKDIEQLIVAGIHH